LSEAKDLRALRPFGLREALRCPFGLAPSGLRLRATKRKRSQGDKKRPQGDMVGGHPERSEGSQRPFGLAASG